MVALYIKASIVTSLVAMLFGMDTGTIGPVTTMPVFKKTFGEFSATLHGVIVSSILLPGALTALFSGVLADKYGRVKIIAIGACIFGVGAAIECGAPILGVFILGRLLKGIGEGLFLSTIYVQVTELSPWKVRGTISALPQFSIVIGIVVGFFVCYGTVRIEDSSVSWRLPMALQALLAFGYSTLLFIVPPSPRWLLSKGRVDEVRPVMVQLGIDEAEQDELLGEDQSRIEESRHVVEQSFMESVKQMMKDFRVAFSKPFRAQTAFGCFIMGMQQFSGIDAVLYYAPLVFQQAGLSSDKASFLASGVSGLVILGVTIPATFLADRWGRKTSSLLGGTLITVIMLLIGALYASGTAQEPHGAGRWVVIVSVYLFAIVYNGTWAIGFRTFLVESLPTKTRSSAASLAQTSNWASNYVVALTTPVLIATSSFGAYFLFAFCSLFCTIACAVFMFETRGHTLEDIEQRQQSSAASIITGKLKDANIRLRRIHLREVSA